MALPDLQVVLTAATDGFEASLNRAVRSAQTASTEISEQVERLNKSFENVKRVAEAAFAAFAVEKFKALIEGSLEAAQKLDRLAQSTGIAVDTLGGLGFAAKLADVDIDSAAAGFVKLDKSIAAAAAGNKEATNVYAALGISVRDASGQVKGADQVLVEAADKFAGYEDGANKTALALALFGKRGAELIPLLNQGGAAIDQNRAYYEKYSGVTVELTQKAAAFEDTQKKISLLTGAFANQLTAELLPSLQGIAGEFLTAKENGNGFKALAEDLATILKGVATAASYVAQYIGNVTNRIGALAASASVAADLFGSSSENSAAVSGLGASFDQKGTQDRVDAQSKAAAALKAIWEAQGEDADKLSKRFDGIRSAINGVTDAQKKASKFDDDYYRSGSGKKTAAPSILTDQAKAQIDPFVEYLNNLTKEGLKFKFDTDNFDRFKGAAGTSKAALVEFDVEFGKFSDAARTAAGQPILTPDQKKQLLDAGKSVADYAEGLERIKALHAFDDSVKQIAVEASLVGQTNEQRQITLALLDLEKKGIKAGTDEYQKRVGTITEAVHQLALAQQLQGVKAFTFAGDQSHNEALFQLSLIGKTKDEVQDLTAARQIDLNVQRQAFDETGKQQVSDEALAALQAEAARQKAQLAVDNTATRDAQRSALTGAKDFFNDYVAAANDAATSVKGALTDAFSAAEDAFVKFVQTGKLDFKSLADTITADLARIAFKHYLSEGLQGLQGLVGADSGLGKILGGVTSAAGTSGASGPLGTAAASASLTTFSTTVTATNAPLLSLTTAAQAAAAALARVAGSSAVSDSSDIGDFATAFELFSAKGNVFSGGNVVPFAKGGVVNSPSIFPLKNGGVGLMGEAGPEAIMPLRRGRDGSLGVQTHGANSSHGGQNVTNVTNINVPVTQTRDLRTAKQFGRSVQRGLN